jgi:heme/copper-type cytochrome/quinol oxidase subunit 3
MNAPAAASPAVLAIPRVVVTDRGTWAMALFIATEATLFVCLFFAYYYLGHPQPRWPPEPPEWRLAVVMLFVLASSSVVLHWSEHRARRGATGSARAGVGATIALGVGFLVLQGVEYHNHLQTLLPTTDAYGSIFYTITGVHGVHVALGLLMLAYVLILPDVTGTSRPPHRPLHNVSLYWHFVDAVWMLIVILLYLVPNVRS